MAMRPGKCVQLLCLIRAMFTRHQRCCTWPRADWRLPAAPEPQDYQEVRDHGNQCPIHQQWHAARGQNQRREQSPVSTYCILLNHSSTVRLRHPKLPRETLPGGMAHPRGPRSCRWTHYTAAMIQLPVRARLCGRLARAGAALTTVSKFLT